eukprot:256930-Pyramimonas_sp.AAC.1
MRMWLYACVFVRVNRSICLACTLPCVNCCSKYVRATKVRACACRSHVALLFGTEREEGEYTNLGTGQRLPAVHEFIQKAAVATEAAGAGARGQKLLRRKQVQPL